MISDESRITLVKDTINQDDVKDLIKWLEKNPRLTKGMETVMFEKKFAQWLGRKNAIFVNSGSSANLAMIYALIQSNRLKNKKVVVPAVSWVTTVAPIMQLGLEPILCDADESNLGLDPEHLEEIFREQNPAVVLLVHVLGIPNSMNDILNLCAKYGVILLEDSCESVGSKYYHRHTGNFGLMASFSTYFGHHFSTIEGGMVVTDDEEMANILKSIRSHGWARDLPMYASRDLQSEHGISDFDALYTFYYPGFNLRSTDLQAHIGIKQLSKLTDIMIKRHENYEKYQEKIINPEWKPDSNKSIYVSNFAYPIITYRRADLVNELNQNGIECRPLICGSIAEQPFWKKYSSKELRLPMAKKVHDFGLYVPNNPDLADHEINLIIDVVNSITNDE